jgi:two-component system, NtrC family, nitrogen regulation response regulator NtrX
MPLKTISESAFDGLRKITWTGNIREFRNVIERLIILGGNEITADDINVFAKPMK